MSNCQKDLGLSVAPKRWLRRIRPTMMSAAAEPTRSDSLMACRGHCAYRGRQKRATRVGESRCEVERRPRRKENGAAVKNGGGTPCGGRSSRIRGIHKQWKNLDSTPLTTTRDDTKEKRTSHGENFENFERKINEDENEKYEHQPAPDHFHAQTENALQHTTPYTQ